MKITFTQPHLNYSIGDSIDVSIEQANYFVLMGIAEFELDYQFDDNLEVSEPKKRGRKPTLK